jgi:hypothetical protein
VTTRRHAGQAAHLLHLDLPAPDETEIGRMWSETTPVLLDLTPKPAGGQEIPSLGSYEISVEIRARNADAIRDAIPVCWNGSWCGRAAIWDHLRVEAPRKVR